MQGKAVSLGGRREKQVKFLASVPGSAAILLLFWTSHLTSSNKRTKKSLTESQTCYEVFGWKDQGGYEKDNEQQGGNKHCSSPSDFFRNHCFSQCYNLCSWNRCYLISFPRYLCLKGREGRQRVRKEDNCFFPCRRIEHLGLNVVLQLLVGVPLEMVHGAARISFVYVAGVVAGRWHLWMPQIEKHLKMVCADFCVG